MSLRCCVWCLSRVTRCLSAESADKLDIEICNIFLLSTTTSAMEPTSSAMSFSLLGSGAPVLAPRVGNLTLPGRKAIATPHHVPLTSRGTVPHIAHDVMRDHTAINSIYAGMEDCKQALILKFYAQNC